MCQGRLSGLAIFSIEMEMLEKNNLNIKTKLVILQLKR
jgi:hypothetical protein